MPPELWSYLELVVKKKRSNISAVIKGLVVEDMEKTNESGGPMREETFRPPAP